MLPAVVTITTACGGATGAGSADGAAREQDSGTTSTGAAAGAGGHVGGSGGGAAQHDAGAGGTTSGAGGAVGDGGSDPGCIPSALRVRTTPITGQVVELDDYTFKLSPTTTYLNATPLTRQVSVEAIGPGGCTVVTTTPKPDGAFSLAGAAEGGYLRIRPVNEPTFMTTLVLIPSSGGAPPFPIVTRTSVADAFALTGSGVLPDPGFAQVIMTCVDLDFRSPYAGATLTAPSGTIGYDGAGATGGYGLAMIQNVAAPPYPGGTMAVQAKAVGPVFADWTAAIATDAVTLLAGGFR